MRIKAKHLLTNAGSPAINQIVITTTEGEYFQSYRSMIAFIPSDGSPIRLSTFWDYSTTTRRYLNQFLGVRYTGKEIKSMIASGSMILDPELRT